MLRGGLGHRTGIVAMLPGLVLRDIVKGMHAVLVIVMGCFMDILLA